MSAIAIENVRVLPAEGGTDGQAEAEAAGPPARKRGGGARTAEGRRIASRNAIKEGFRSRIHVDEEEKEAIAAHLAAKTEQYAPTTDEQRWLVAQMAEAAARIDRCHDRMPLDQARLRMRAATDWDSDRQVYIEQLGARLAREPRRSSTALLGSLHGVQFLKDHWEMLADVLETEGSFTEAQHELMMDLMGIPHALRVNNGAVPAATDTEGLTELVDRHIADLTVLEGLLEPCDERDRELALDGIPLEEDAVTRRLRRGEAEAQRALKRARDELLRLQAQPAAPPGTLASAVPEPEPADLPPRPVPSAQAKIHLMELSLIPPGLFLMREQEEVVAEAAPLPDAEPEPEPDPEAQPEPEPQMSPMAEAFVPVVAATEPLPELELVRPSSTPPRNQAERTRRDRRRRRRVEQMTRKKGR